MMRARLIALAPVVAFAALAVALGTVAGVPVAELAWAVASAAAALAPAGVVAPSGWRRRTAEAALLPAAYALAMVEDPTMRRMMVPPLLVLTGLAATAAALRTARGRSPELLLPALAMAVRLAGGLGLTGEPPWTIAIAMAAPAVMAWAFARAGEREAGVLAAVVVGALPWQHAPLWAIVLAAAAVLGAARLRGLGEAGVARGWSSALLPIALVATAAAAWGGIAPARALPAAGWLAIVGALVAAVVTPRLPAGLAGAAWLAVTLALGPVQPAPPDRAAVQLAAGAPRAELPASDGRTYVIEISLANAAALADGTPVATLEWEGERRTLAAGVDTAEWAHERADVLPIVAHPLPARPVWRPGGVGKDAFWGVAGRATPPVPARVAPVITRQVPGSIGLSVVTAGPSRPTPPRSLSLAAWILAAALAVAAVQLAGGGWRAPGATLPWALLVTASVVARMPVEPLRLVLERHGVDVALAALLAAWLPAARVLLARRRELLAAALLLVPLALATPGLTPSLYGDEPFHLVVLRSLAEDWDLQLDNNLDLERYPYNRIYITGEIFLHSPVLAALLLPGYAVLGRSGALLLLALAGAAVAALICRRAVALGAPPSRVALLFGVLLLGYPLATYSSQIWVEVPGALATAASLVWLAAGPPRRGMITAAAVVAGAIKMRLALVTLPVAAVAWWPARWRGRELARTIAVLVAAATAVVAVTWAFLGGPLGLRKPLDLLPRNLSLPATVVGGLAFDPAGGLAFTAPLLLLALAGAPLLWRRGGAGERAMLLGGGATVLALLASLEWYGGGAPPARYLVPLLPAFALAGAMLLRAPARARSLAPLLLPPTVLAWAALITRPHLSVNPGDGGWWLADALARRFAAGARHLFPSFLTPRPATYIVPLALIALAGAGVALARRPGAARMLARSSVALWLAGAAVLIVAVRTRVDHVVEVEEPQVARHGGTPEPPEGTFARYRRANGWRLADGEGVVVPLRLPLRATVEVEGWLDGAARQGATLLARWDDGETRTLPVSGAGAGKLPLPAPPGAGRHRLSLRLQAPPAGSVVLDRIVVR